MLCVLGLALLSASYPRTKHANLFHAHHQPWMDLFLARTLSAAPSVASTVPPSALLALRSSSESQGWLPRPQTPWAQTDSFLYWRLLAGKNRQRFRPVRANNTGELDDHAPGKNLAALMHCPISPWKYSSQAKPNNFSILGDHAFRGPHGV